MRFSGEPARLTYLWNKNVSHYPSGPDDVIFQIQIISVVTVNKQSWNLDLVCGFFLFFFF